MDIDPKLIIGAALALPFIYQFLGWDFSIYFLAALAGYAWYTFDNNFINKASVERKNIPSLGPQQPFLPQDKQWEIGQDGTPIQKYQPPAQLPPQYPPPPTR